MKSETRRQKLLELWDDDEEAQEIIKEKLAKTPEEKIVADELSMQGEAFLAYVGSMEDFVRKHCVSCDNEFVSSYGRITTCSNRCLKKAIEDAGFYWDPTKPTEYRWRPMIERFPLLRRDKETLESFEGRKENWRRHLQVHHPVPMVVPSEATMLLDKIREFELEIEKMFATLHHQEDSLTHQSQSQN